MSIAALNSRLTKASKKTLPTWDEMSSVMFAVCPPMTNEQRTAVKRFAANPEDATAQAAYESWYLPHKDKLAAAWDEKCPRWRESIELWNQGIDT